MFWNKDRIPNSRENQEDEDFFKFEEESFEEKSQQVEEPLKQEKEEKTYHQRDNYKKLNKIVNIVLIVIMILGVCIMIDVISVTRFEKGPYFAIHTGKEKNGTINVYYGIGYKVIKYREIKGRNDTVIGPWSMKINTTPKKVEMLDLALEFNNNLPTALESYMSKYLKVTGEIKTIGENQLVLIYEDEDEKYTTQLTCQVLNSTKNYKKKDTITLVGTLYNYSSEKKVNLQMKNCYLIEKKNR